MHYKLLIRVKFPKINSDYQDRREILFSHELEFMGVENKQFIKMMQSI